MMRRSEGGLGVGRLTTQRAVGSTSREQGAACFERALLLPIDADAGLRLYERVHPLERRPLTSQAPPSVGKSEAASAASRRVGTMRKQQAHHLWQTSGSGDDQRRAAVGIGGASAGAELQQLRGSGDDRALVDPTGTADLHQWCGVVGSRRVVEQHRLPAGVDLADPRG